MLRFVRFADAGNELVVAHFEHAIVYVTAYRLLPTNFCLHRKRFTIQPWHLLGRKLLGQDDDGGIPGVSETECGDSCSNYM